MAENRIRLVLFPSIVLMSASASRVVMGFLVGIVMLIEITNSHLSYFSQEERSGSGKFCGLQPFLLRFCGRSCQSVARVLGTVLASAVVNLEC